MAYHLARSCVGPFEGTMHRLLQTKHFGSPHRTFSTKGSSPGIPAYFSVFPVPQSWSQADEELLAFPEIADALRAMENNQYQTAISSLARAKDICESYAGANGELTQAISRLRIGFSDVMGDFKAAKTAFKHLNGIEETSDWEKFLIGQAECRMHLHNGDATRAIQCASDVHDTSIRLKNSGPNPLSAAMEMTGLECIGVSQMLVGEYDGAYERFKEANQIGTTIQASGDALEESVAEYVSSSCLRNMGAYEYYVNRDLARATALWRRAYGPKYSAAASGDFETVLKEAADRATRPCSSLLTLNRCGSLNNIGMVYVKQGDYDEATAVLGAAMKLSESLPDDLKTPESVLKSFNFGRTLRLLAQVYHANDQAVTSEGLYRSCIKQYEMMPGSPRPMYEYQMANAKSGYSRLLASWDKRDREAASLEEESVLLYDKVDGRFSQFEITLSSIFSWPGWSL